MSKTRTVVVCGQSIDLIPIILRHPQSSPARVIELRVPDHVVLNWESSLSIDIAVAVADLAKYGTHATYTAFRDGTSTMTLYCDDSDA